jgi:transcription antitermination factor NusG
VPAIVPRNPSVLHARALRAPEPNPKNSMVAELSTTDALCLPPDIESPSALSGEMFVAHTKSRQEKSLARDLRLRGIGYYLPLGEKVTQTSQRRRYIVEDPLFAGYVFFAGDAGTQSDVMATGRVCQTIRVPDQVRLRLELANLYAAWLINPRMESMPALVKGTPVRVTRGALEGVEGIIIERKRSAILVLQVSGFGQAAIEIPMDLVEPA